MYAADQVRYKTPEKQPCPPEYQRPSVVTHAAYIYEPGAETLPFDWTAYFQTPGGIYMVNIIVQATGAEVKNYQDIFPHSVGPLTFR